MHKGLLHSEGSWGYSCVAGDVVIAWPVGRPRPFWNGFGLAVATLSFYAFYWDYKAHREVFDQFELQREWRDDGAVWYIMGFLLPVLRFVYYYHFAANLEYIRSRMRLPTRASPGVILTLMILATTALVAASISGLILITLAADEDGEIVDSTRFGVGLGVIAAGFVAWTLLKAAAYWRLQGAANDVWRVYAWRMEMLRSGARGVPPPQPDAPPRLSSTGGASGSGGP